VRCAGTLTAEQRRFSLAVLAVSPRLPRTWMPAAGKPYRGDPGALDEVELIHHRVGVTASAPGGGIPVSTPSLTSGSAKRFGPSGETGKLLGGSTGQVRDRGLRQCRDRGAQLRAQVR